MSLLTICAYQVNEREFVVKNNTSQQTYDGNSEDWNLYTGITLKITKVNETTPALSLDITSDFAYLFDNTGLHLNFSDFGEDTFNDYDYWPDWAYTVTVTYTYDSEEYSASYTVCFHSIISNVVRQQAVQANWRDYLNCGCNCAKYDTITRKLDFFWLMRSASELCLIDEWHAIMFSLYKLSGVQHEFNTQYQ